MNDEGWILRKQKNSEMGSPRGRHCLNEDEKRKMMSDSRGRVSLLTPRELLVLFNHEKYRKKYYKVFPLSIRSSQNVEKKKGKSSSKSQNVISKWARNVSRKI